MCTYTPYVPTPPYRCDALTAEHDIYLTRDGRISLAGINKVRSALHGA